MKERYTEKQLDKLMSDFDEIISEMPDDELMEQIRESGDDPKAVADELRFMASLLLKRFGLDKKSRASIRYEKLLLKYKNFIGQWIPPDLKESKELFASFLMSKAEVSHPIVQFRKASSPPEADAANMLGKLQFLATEFGASEISEPSENVESSDMPGDAAPELTYSPGGSPDFYKSPELLLEELEITEPNEIDVEAIAYSQGALVIYEPLQKCEAYTLSKDTNNAVIVVNDKSIRSRQRFSVAHELGHWMRDRNISAFCEKKSYTESWYGKGSETLANQYAKDLLLPRSMFAPLAKNLPVTFESVRKLAELFGTSLTATALRLTELGSCPAVIVFSKFSRAAVDDPAQRIWYFKGTDVAADLDLHWKMNDRALAYEIRIDDEKHEVSGDIDAAAWFIVPEDQTVTLHEESIRINCNFILTMLSWEQPV